MFICVIPDGFIIYDKNSLWIRKFGKQEKSISIFIILSNGITRMCRLVCVFVACLLGIIILSISACVYEVKCGPAPKDCFRMSQL